MEAGIQNRRGLLTSVPFPFPSYNLAPAPSPDPVPFPHSDRTTVPTVEDLFDGEDLEANVRYLTAW